MPKQKSALKKDQDKALSRRNLIVSLVVGITVILTFLIELPQKISSTINIFKATETPTLTNTPERSLSVVPTSNLTPDQFTSGLLEAQYGCPDRLLDDVTRSDDQSRLRPPYNLEITYRASVSVPGRILAEVNWVHADARHVSSLIKISGRRGLPSEDDMSVRLDELIPPEGKCGVWYRQVQDIAQYGSDVIDGLWPYETYCFSVNDSDEDGGHSAPYPSIATAPICQKAEWYAAWGEPATPPP